MTNYERRSRFIITTGATTAAHADTLEEIRAIYKKQAAKGYIAQIEEEDETDAVIEELEIETWDELVEMYGWDAHRIIESKGFHAVEA